MFAVILSSIIALSGAQADTKDFLAMFAKRKSDYPTEKVDPAIVKCMDMVIAKLLAESSSQSTEADIVKLVKPFADPIEAKRFSETEFRNLQGAVSYGSDRVAISVHMGSASRLRAFSTTDKTEIPLPKQFEWSSPYGAVPIVMAGGDIVVDGMVFQDAGVRYGYREWFLHPNEGKYELTKTLSGVWTLADSDADYHIGIDQGRITVRTMSEPKSFYLSGTIRILTSTSVYELKDGIPVRRSYTDGEPAVRAVDAWMLQALKAPKTDLEKKFKRAYGKASQMLDEWSQAIVFSKPAKVELVIEGEKYTFTLVETSTGYKVTAFSVKRT